ncbi:hypothetical protein GCM10027021_29400 [Dyella kyungheensis]
MISPPVATLADLAVVCTGAGAVLVGDGALCGGLIGAVDGGAGAAGAGALVAGDVGVVLEASWFLPHALSTSSPARVAQYKAVLRGWIFMTDPMAGGGQAPGRHASGAGRLFCTRLARRV